MEKAILVGVQLPKTRHGEIENSLTELHRLAQTAGAEVVEVVVQRRPGIDPAYFIGRGKAAQLRDRAQEKGVRTVIFDDDLKPIQQKNLEELLDTKIIDRTRLILDIFAHRARSKEGKLQVERAELAYYLPRLSKRGVTLDSQVGGIGTRRGPGEKKLEIDQRRIRDRIAMLDREIDTLCHQRDLLRKKRAQSGQPVVAIVGYTNAGKSTLLNALSAASPVYADDRYFATLDPTTRKVKLPGGRPALFTDTVGFINKLPHSLIAAFRATLEEVTTANCLLHVVDISHPQFAEQARTVYGVLKELGAQNIPAIVAYNKADMLPAEQRQRLERQGELLISARTGGGIPGLLERIAAVLTPRLVAHTITVPYAKSGMVPEIYKNTVIRTQDYTERGIQLKLESSPENWERLKALLDR